MLDVLDGAKVAPAPQLEVARQPGSATPAGPMLPVAAPPPTPANWRGTFGEALRESERAAPGRAAFVSADWERYASVRVESARSLEVVARGLTPEGGRPVYAVREDGTLHNTVTGHDEFVRLVEGGSGAPPRLQKALEKHLAGAAAREECAARSASGWPNVVDASGVCRQRYVRQTLDGEWAGLRADPRLVARNGAAYNDFVDRAFAKAAEAVRERRAIEEELRRRYGPAEFTARKLDFDGGARWALDSPDRKLHEKYETHRYWRAADEEGFWTAAAGHVPELRSHALTETQAGRAVDEKGFMERTRAFLNEDQVRELAFYLASAGFAVQAARFGAGAPPQAARLTPVEEEGVRAAAPARPVEVPATESREQRMVERRAANEQLRASSRFAEDLKKVGVTAEQIERMFAKKVPLGFESEAQFGEFKTELDAALKNSGLGDAEAGLKGTSTTFYSENPGKPLGHHWDADPAYPGDFDVNLFSKRLVQDMHARGVEPSSKYGIYRKVAVRDVYEELRDFMAQWTERLGRDVNIVAHPSAPARDASEYILRRN